MRHRNVSQFVVFQIVEPAMADDVHIIGVAESPVEALRMVREAFIDLRTNVIHDIVGPEVDITLPTGELLTADADVPVTPGELAELDQAWEAELTAFQQRVMHADWAVAQILRNDELTSTTYVIQRLGFPGA